jgi:hypothetical protein
MVSTYRRAAGIAAAVVMVAGSGVAAHAADAGKKPLKVRIVTIDYTGGCGFNVNAEAVTASGAPSSCAAGDNYAVQHKAGEKYLTILVDDQSGSAVSGSLWLKGGTGNAVSEPFCGSLKNYAMKQSAYTLDLNTSADPTCPGAATTGTLTVKFSNLPIK